jgi:hypothetical protein
MSTEPVDNNDTIQWAPSMLTPFRELWITNSTTGSNPSWMTLSPYSRTPVTFDVVDSFSTIFAGLKIVSSPKQKSSP